MPEHTPQRSEDEGRRDIQLEDLARGVGTLINFVSDVIESVSSAVSQPRSSAARPLSRPPLQAHTGTEATNVRQPLLELFDEGEEIVLVVEWLDGDASQIEIGVEDDVLSLSFGGEAPAVDLLLPAVVDPSSLRLAVRNGISEIRLRRARDAEGER
jgi:HSP20 family molecular chaperone IbpA